MQTYDVVIVGSGLGGLLCAVILAKEGMSVAVIEQNKQIGGCLQTFSFEKKVFDSCVHYIGAMEEGQTQRRIFDYAGISNGLKLKKLDNDCFDKIIFAEDEQEYPQAQGLENFIEQLLPFFPNERQALQQYMATLQSVGSAFPLYNLRNGDATEKEKVSGWAIADMLNRITPNKKLQNVLTGNNLLYAGDKYTTPFYIHSLVAKSYIDSAYKCVGGSSQVSKALWRQLQSYGGTIFRNEKVSRIVEENGMVSYVETIAGGRYYADRFIVNIHPAQALNILQSEKIKPAYRKRLQEQQNSVSAFMVNVVLRPKTLKYPNHNIYWNRSNDAFDALNKVKGKNDGIYNYALYFTEDENHPGYADTVAVLTYMDKQQTAQWAVTHNRSAEPSVRCDMYEAFKIKKAEDILDTVGERFPEIRQNILSYQSASPLTFRDYMGSADGSMYGIMADAGFPEASRIPVRTKIPNMFFTGQNVNLHGVLGVSITAIATCGELVGPDYLLRKL